MDRVSMVIGTVLMALLLMTTPVAATAPLASQDGGPVRSETGIADPGTNHRPAFNTVSLNDTDENETTGGNTTTDVIEPCCGGGGSGPVDRPVWKYDGNYDAEINYSEADASYQDYLDDVVTWETYLNVSDAYFDNATVLYPDPDDDGMTIREEEVWSDQGAYFAKYSTNIDDDQFSDFADPRPNTEDIPPKIDVTDPAGGTLNRGYGESFIQNVWRYEISNLLTTESLVDEVYQNGEKRSSSATMGMAIRSPLRLSEG